MLFGVTIEPEMLIFGGTALLLMLSLQVLVGARKIRLRGRLHLTVHTYGAYALLVLAGFHGLAGLVFFNHWRIG